jgi:hypothetical protein
VLRFKVRENNSEAGYFIMGIKRATGNEPSARHLLVLAAKLISGFKSWQAASVLFLFRIVFGKEHHRADAPHVLRLLCPCQHWPRCCASQGRDELAPSHEALPETPNPIQNPKPCHETKFISLAAS